MGRSVSVPRDAAIVCYSSLDNYFETCPDSGELFGDWDYDVLEVIQEQVKEKYPSFKETYRWLGREDMTILENTYCGIGVSEYCGLLSIWLVPYVFEDNDNRHLIGLQKRFITVIEPWFKKTFGDLTKLGTASNGEAFFERREKVG
jgi:hypothetical protein